MRIAFLADIHGNLPAFEAALDHVAQQHVDRVIFVGDLVVGSVSYTHLDVYKRQFSPSRPPIPRRPRSIFAILAA